MKRIGNILSIKLFAMVMLAIILSGCGSEKSDKNVQSETESEEINETLKFEEKKLVMKAGNLSSNLKIINVSENYFEFEFLAFLDVQGDGTNVRTGVAEGTAEIVSETQAEYVAEKDSKYALEGAKISFVIDEDRLIVTADDNELGMGAYVVVSGTYY